jgi:hypothetical protein
MKSTRTIWKNNFNSENIPNWPCPYCSIGILEGDKDNFTVFETEASKKYKRELEWEPEWIAGIFNGILTCGNNKCKEKIIISGKMSVGSTLFQR